MHHIVSSIIILLVIFCLMKAWFDSKPPEPKKREWEPTVPKPRYVMPAPVSKEKEAEIVMAKIRHIKALAKKGKHEKAIALLSKLDV
jgi:hypothetical protein